MMGDGKTYSGGNVLRFYTFVSDERTEADNPESLLSVKFTMETLARQSLVPQAIIRI